jgi:inner membrane protein
MFKSLKNTLSSRIVVITLIALSISIPLGMIKGVVSERNYYYNNVINEISALWGSEQTITGPLLVVPFIEKHETEEQVKNDVGKIETKLKKRYIRKHAVILPDKLALNTTLSEQYRKRGIYNSLVYSSNLELGASFYKVDLSLLSNHIYRIAWEEAELVIGLSDTKAIDKIHEISLNGKTLDVAAGVGKSNLVSSGFSARVPKSLVNGQNLELSIALDMNGSHGFRFTPVGETTVATIKSTWPHPKFAGQLVPDRHQIDESGFEAHWEIPHLARNYPQMWVDEHQQVNINELVTGVDLFEPVFIYSKITRAVKYGLLFVGLTFITFFLFEISIKSALHYVQYGLVGIALSLFYLLLLSLSEHISFAWAYLFSAFTCITMISGYVGHALRNNAKGLLLFSILSLLFGLIYTLLRLEDFALLTGTVLLLAALAGLMFITRDINHAPLENEASAAVS